MTRPRTVSVKALILQGPELLRLHDAAEILAKVPFVAVMATHEEPALDRAHCVLPAAMWAEIEGTFTNYQRRVQRIKRALAPPGDARPHWELAAALLKRLGNPLRASSVRELFAEIAKTAPDYAGLDYRSLGVSGRALTQAALPAPEARA